jgi:RNA polymerase sigma-70 factor (ECF subfamily)
VFVALIQDIDDAAIVARCLAGDTSSFETLVVRYQRVLFTVALRMLGSREEARDATQSALLKAYERLDTYDPKFRFFSWMYRILTNECLNVIRGRRPQEPVTPDLLVTTRPVDHLEEGQRRAAVQRALSALSPEYREVIVLRHFADLSYDEMAETLGIPAKTVKSRLYSARQQLGERLLGWRPA